MQKLVEKKFDFIEFDFNNTGINNIKTKENLTNYPVNYILYNKKRYQAYIGETTQIKTRLFSHRKDIKRKLLNKGIIIYSEKFNKSATYNIETNLINYFLADDNYTLQNISQTSKSIVHNYFEKRYFNEEMFNEIWERLRSNNIVKKSLIELTNSDIFKLSPFKSLTYQQRELQEKIIKFINDSLNKEEPQVLFINGEAGTGKSVLLSSTYKLINDLARDSGNLLSGYKNNYITINNEEIFKSYLKIVSKVKGLRKTKVLKPTTLVNKIINKKITKPDIVLIDEAHLLLTKPNNFRSFSFDNHLEKIIECSKIIICFYDDKQVIRFDKYWNKDVLNKIRVKYNIKDLYLTEQLRMEAGANTIDWINSFVYGELKKYENKDSYTIKVVDSFKRLHDTIKQLNKEDKMSRVVSTFDFLHLKNKGDFYVESEGYKIPWNRTYNNTWAEEVSSIDEVGSIYTVQGFDLNNVGVMIGPSIDYDEKENKLVYCTSRYKDTGAYKHANNFSDEKKEEIKIEIIKNSLNILLKRGIKGLYIFAYNPKLQKKLKELIK